MNTDPIDLRRNGQPVSVRYLLQDSTLNGVTYQHIVHNVASVAYEPYPPLPDDCLLVLRNPDGRIIAGPLSSEVRNFEPLP
jgi:hypothetical protein